MAVRNWSEVRVFANVTWSPDRRHGSKYEIFNGGRGGGDAFELCFRFDISFFEQDDYSLARLSVYRVINLCGQFTLSVSVNSSRWRSGWH